MAGLRIGHFSPELSLESSIIAKLAQGEFDGPQGKRPFGVEQAALAMDSFLPTQGVLAETPILFERALRTRKARTLRSLSRQRMPAALRWRLAFQLQGAGFTPTELSTEAAVSLEPEGQGFRITRSALDAAAPMYAHLDEATFAKDSRQRHEKTARYPRFSTHRSRSRRTKALSELATGKELCLHSSAIVVSVKRARSVRSCRDLFTP